MSNEGCAVVQDKSPLEDSFENCSERLILLGDVLGNLEQRLITVLNPRVKEYVLPQTSEKDAHSPVVNEVDRLGGCVDEITNRIQVLVERLDI